MKAKIIKTEPEYQETLERIETLIEDDPSPNTDAGEELELLAHLVEEYENREFPIPLPEPVEAIRFRMEQLGLKQRDLAQYFGSASRVSEVLRGKRQLSLKMIRALNKNLGIQAEALIQGQKSVDFEACDEIDWDRFPVKEMVKRGWLKFNADLRQAQERVEELMRGWLNMIATPFTEPIPVRFRQKIRKGSQSDIYALQAWQFRIIELAGQQALPATYKPGQIDEAFIRHVVSLSYFETGPKLAVEYLEKHGIHFIIESHLPKTHLDGAALVLPNGVPLIALTLRHDRIDNFWFTLCHELAHLALHYEDAREKGYLDELDEINGDKQEDEADTLAAESLIPSEEWSASQIAKKPTTQNAKELAEKLKISPAIVAGRARHVNKNFRILSRLVSIKSSQILFEASDY